MKKVIAIFDVGKTNKKFFLFDENYEIVFERTARFIETTDEDGEACENLESLQSFVCHSLDEVSGLKDFEIKAVNFCSYGASLVYLDEDLQPCAPLYNYLKEYPEYLKKQFYDNYSGEEEFSFRTASPVLGSLNSGMQLYRIKYEKPELFKRIKYALHLPQYLSFLVSARVCSDITSIGCHTNLWDFRKNKYHYWVKQEGILEKLAPIVSSRNVVPASLPGCDFLVGTGLHDSSAALIPYLVNFQEPFILISTGTWCISLNPFNHLPLTKEELQNDCLCYMTYNARPVKASRLFAGNEHEQQVKRIAAHFNTSPDRYAGMEYNPEIISKLQKKGRPETTQKVNLKTSLFRERNPGDFANDEEAYHQLMLDIVSQQFVSTKLVLKGTNVKRIFVDGGFSSNSIYMNLLAAQFPSIKVLAASMPQATAIGAALAIHDSWNPKPMPNGIIKLKDFSNTHYPERRIL